MKPSIQQLQKFFRLEATRHYDNHAVIGGLERILDWWVPDARNDGLPEDLINLIVTRLNDYGRLTDKSRAETLKGLWKRIQRGETDIPDEGGDFSRPVDERPAEAAGASDELSEAAAPSAAEPATPAPETAIRPPEQPQAPQPPVPQPQQRTAPQFTAAQSTPPYAAPYKPAVQTANLPPAVAPEALNAPLTTIQGVGPKYAAALEKLGLRTLRDLLYYFPRRYDDYSRMIPINRLAYGEEVTVIGTVQNVATRPIHSGKHQITEAVVGDGTGSLRITWFNQRFIAQRLSAGAHISLSGKVKQYLGRPVMDNPVWEYLEEEHLHTGRIAPVYGLSSGIKIKWLRRLISTVVSYWAVRVPDHLPAELRRAAGLVGIHTALMQAHLPDSLEDLKAAQERLAFDEIFLLQLGVQAQKRLWQERTARVFESDDEWLQSQTARLPFALTGAQQRVIADIRHDLAAGRPMNRLIQGDVGSGKTVVAALAVALVTRSEAQAALMAPTSILAEQHYKSLLRVLAGVQPTAEPVQAQLSFPIAAEPPSDERLETSGSRTKPPQLSSRTKAKPRK